MCQKGKGKCRNVLENLGREKTTPNNFHICHAVAERCSGRRSMNGWTLKMMTLKQRMRHKWRRPGDWMRKGRASEQPAVRRVRAQKRDEITAPLASRDYAFT